jgi:monoamine oxidase
LFRLVNGYDGVVEWLRAKLDPPRVTLHLNTVVTAIRWRRESVTARVQSPSGHALPSFKARRAIITLPLGVWQADAGAEGGVRFEPELKEKRAAASRLVMGPVSKIVLCFRERFWEQLKRKGGDLTQMSFLHALNNSSVACPIAVWWTAQPLKAPVLTGWAGGPAAESLSHRGEGFILERALSSLAQLFGLSRAEVEGQFSAWFTHDWQADPFARGAYSYVSVGGINAPKALAAPVDDTLFFAGEATDFTGQSGLVHGALATGRRAAAEVLRACQSGR